MPFNFSCLINGFLFIILKCRTNYIQIHRLFSHAIFVLSKQLQRTSKSLKRKSLYSDCIWALEFKEFMALDESTSVLETQSSNLGGLGCKRRTQELLSCWKKVVGEWGTGYRKGLVLQGFRKKSLKDSLCYLPERDQGISFCTSLFIFHFILNSKKRL